MIQKNTYGHQVLKNAWVEHMVGVVSAGVVVSAGGGGGVRSIVIFSQRCGVIGGGVDIRLLDLWREEVGSFIWQ